jgi:methionyl aminopeptidase
MEPHILNFGKAGHGPTIEAGMVFAIEPMITLGSEKTKVLDDNWTVVTQDKSYGAHFENSYCIAPDGKPFVLSELDGGAANLARFGIEVSPLLS